MYPSAYELPASILRYVFAALMVLIVARALRGALTDSRRAARLRRLSPETGIIGELLVTDGGERARNGMRYPLTLEGSIGSSRSADIRVRHSSIRARHAIYQMTERGLYVRGHAGLRIGRNRESRRSDVLLKDGDTLRVGGVQLLLILTDGGEFSEVRPFEMPRAAAPGMPRRDDVFADDFFTPQPSADELFRSNPLCGFTDTIEEDEATDHDTGYFSEDNAQPVFRTDESDGGFDPVRVPRQRNYAADPRRPDHAADRRAGGGTHR